MSPFEEFTRDIDVVARAHKRGPISRFLLWLQYHDLRRRNEPLPFRIVSEDQGEAVGEQMEVFHLSLHDMMEHQALGQLTAEVLLKGRRINAFSLCGYTQVEEMVGKTTIQPRWI